MKSLFHYFKPLKENEQNSSSKQAQRPIPVPSGPQHRRNRQSGTGSRANRIGALQKKRPAQDDLQKENLHPITGAQGTSAIDQAQPRSAIVDISDDRSIDGESPGKKLRLQNIVGDKGGASVLLAGASKASPVGEAETHEVNEIPNTSTTKLHEARHPMTQRPALAEMINTLLPMSAPATDKNLEIPHEELMSLDPADGVGRDVSTPSMAPIIAHPLKQSETSSLATLDQESNARNEIFDQCATNLDEGEIMPSPMIVDLEDPHSGNDDGHYVTDIAVEACEPAAPQSETATSSVTALDTQPGELQSEDRNFLARSSALSSSAVNKMDTEPENGTDSTNRATGALLDLEAKSADVRDAHAGHSTTTITQHHAQTANPTADSKNCLQQTKAEIPFAPKVGELVDVIESDGLGRRRLGGPARVLAAYEDKTFDLRYVLHSSRLHKLPISEIRPLKFSPPTGRPRKAVTLFNPAETSTESEGRRRPRRAAAATTEIGKTDEPTRRISSRRRRIPAGDATTTTPARRTEPPQVRRQDSRTRSSLRQSSRQNSTECTKSTAPVTNVSSMLPPQSPYPVGAVQQHLSPGISANSRPPPKLSAKKAPTISKKLPTRRLCSNNKMTLDDLPISAEFSFQTFLQNINGSCEYRQHQLLSSLRALSVVYGWNISRDLATSLLSDIKNFSPQDLQECAITLQIVAHTQTSSIGNMLRDQITWKTLTDHLEEAASAQTKSHLARPFLLLEMYTTILLQDLYKHGSNENANNAGISTVALVSELFEDIDNVNHCISNTIFHCLSLLRRTQKLSNPFVYGRAVTVVSRLIHLMGTCAENIAEYAKTINLELRALRDVSLRHCLVQIIPDLPLRNALLFDALPAHSTSVKKCSRSFGSESQRSSSLSVLRTTISSTESKSVKSLADEILKLSL